MHTPQRQRGLTLIEVVVAMLIMAILAAIAIPSYSSYTRKAHRTDAKSALLDLASLEERYFTTQNAYTNDQSQLGYGTSAAAGTAFPVGSGYYNVTITQAVAPTAPNLGAATPTAGTPAYYQIKAVAQGAQAKDTQCVTYIIDSKGQQTSQDASSADTTTTGGCWN